MAVRTGFIFLWSGAIADIPAGFHLCDGSAYDGENLPDLRNRFIVGAGDHYLPNGTGGSDSQTHTFTGDGHNHTFAPDSAIASGADFSAIVSSSPAVGTTDSADNRPQYFSLAFIIKL